MKHLKPQEERFFRDQVMPLLETEPVQRMAEFPQHGNTHCLAHCLAVAYYSYRLCCRLRLRCDRRALIRGALLHDFFLYDWHVPDESHRLHGFTHPAAALDNAERHFALSPTERDIIAKHMWPLTLKWPACKESLLVSLVDKGCTLAESLAPLFGHRPCLYAFRKALHPQASAGTV